jgi:hypothetical protein
LNTLVKKALIAFAIIIVVITAVNILISWYAWRAYLGSIQPSVAFAVAQLPAAPDYAHGSTWVITPQDPGLSVVTPGSLRPLPVTETEADVFFVHPTTYFGKDNWNAGLESFTANQMLEGLVVPSQMSVFNACCRIYAPRYRQATLYAFMSADDDGRQALQAAYGDVRRAFEHYMAAQNNGRPFILASHSQGTLHAIRLLEEVIAQADYRDRMIAAYLPGFSLPQDKRQTTLSWLPLCATGNSIRCLVAWDTYAETGGPKHRTDQGQHYYADADGGHWERRSGKVATCVNPLSWSPDLGVADKKQHKGATYVVLPGIGNASLKPILAPLIRNDISARCDEDGYLYISAPTSPVYYIGMMPGEWFHNHDYGLFYMNIRENAVARVNAYLDLH